MNEQVWWYLARSAGIVAAVLLVSSLVLGVLFATRVMRAVDRPAWLLAMHRWLSTLTVVATALHLAGLVADEYVHFGWQEILVPWGSAWRPGAVTLGVIALYLMVAVYGTSLFMKRIPKRWWRAIHFSSYAMVWFGIVHAALAGTDVSSRPYQATAMLLTMAAVTAALLRVVVGRTRPSPDRAGPRRATPGGRAEPTPT